MSDTGTIRITESSTSTLNRASTHRFLTISLNQGSAVGETTTFWIIFSRLTSSKRPDFSFLGDVDKSTPEFQATTLVSRSKAYGFDLVTNGSSGLPEKLSLM